VVGIVFRWTESRDPNPEDSVTYTIEYTSSSKFEFLQSVNGIKTVEFRPSGLLPEYAKLYWRVKAVDSMGSITLSKPAVSSFFTLSRSHTLSTDRKVEVKVETELPIDVRIKIVKVTSSDNDTGIRQAGISARYDSLVRLVTDEFYRLLFVDSKGQEVSLPEPVWLTLTFKFADENSDGWLDTNPGEVAVNDLRICRLNEGSTWLNTGVEQYVYKNTQTITTRVNRAGYYTVLGYSQPAELISRVTNFPNPFNPRQENTVIRYVLTADAEIKIRIYNPVGDLVTILHRLPGEDGGQGLDVGKENIVIWDGRTNRDLVVANGTYLCSITAMTDKMNKTLTRLVTVLK
jgi:hypothetical protein